MTNLENKILVSVSMKTNPNNETFIFGQFGKSPKHSIVSTLWYVEPGADGEKILRFFERRIGKTYKEFNELRAGLLSREF